MKSIQTLFILSLCVLSLFSCRTDLDNEVKQVGIYLTDCPFEAEAVFVEILKVLAEDEEGLTIELNTAAGIYDLLNFQDGVDTLLASGNVDFETLENLYFELGENNSIVVEGETYPLELKQDNVVKVKIDFNLFESGNDLVVDFYACTSIIRKNGRYELKPVIKFKGPKGAVEDHIEDLLEDFEDCYSVVYPINLIDVDSSVVSVNTDEELVDILLTGTIVDISYPITLSSLDAETLEVISEAELKQLVEECEDDEDEDDDDDDDDDENHEGLESLEEALECYTPTYPLMFLDMDNSVVSIDNVEQLESVLEEEEFELVFPIELSDDEQVYTITNTEELEAIAEECEDDEDDEDEDEDDDDDDDDENHEGLESLEEALECYTPTYPLMFLDMDNSVVSIDNVEQLESVLEEEEFELVFPIELSDDEQVYTITNTEELEAIAEECEDDEDESDDFEELITDIQECYTLVFPLTVQGSANSQFIVNDIEELQSLMLTEELVQFDFPVQLLDSDNQTIDVQNNGQLNQLLNDCE